MPAIGDCWAANTWDDDAWAANTWADAVAIVITNRIIQETLSPLPLIRKLVASSIVSSLDSKEIVDILRIK